MKIAVAVLLGCVALAQAYPKGYRPYPKYQPLLKKQPFLFGKPHSPGCRRHGGFGNTYGGIFDMGYKGFDNVQYGYLDDRNFWGNDKKDDFSYWGNDDTNKFGFDDNYGKGDVFGFDDKVGNGINFGYDDKFGQGYAFGHGQDIRYGQNNKFGHPVVFGHDDKFGRDDRYYDDRFGQGINFDNVDTSVISSHSSGSLYPDQVQTTGFNNYVPHDNSFGNLVNDVSQQHYPSVDNQHVKTATGINNQQPLFTTTDNIGIH